MRYRQVRRPVVCRVPCDDLEPLARYRLQHLYPRVRAAVADEVAGHIASGDAEQPAKRKHQMRVVLADAVSRGERLACRCMHGGPVKPIAHVPIHPAAHGPRKFGALSRRGGKLGGHGTQRRCPAG